MSGIAIIPVLMICVLSLQAQDYNVMNYGAVADGRTLTTGAIQAAVDAAHNNGGGRVVLPEGSYLSGSVVLKSNVTLHLTERAILLGSTNPGDYLVFRRWKALVMADRQENIGITGKGTIDGQGRALALHIDSLFYRGVIDSSDYNFVEMRPKYYLRPQLVEFKGCRGIEVRGVTMKNAACWVQQYDQCSDIVIDSLTVISDAYWNNDGIDISDCKNVRFTNSFVDSSDDGICIKSHSDEWICDSIYISDCVVRSSASAVKFGTKSLGGFTNVVIRNIKVYDTFRSAIAIESVDGGLLENVLVENIEAKNTGNAIFIRIGQRIRNKPPGILRNVTIRNLVADIAFERPDYAYDVRGPALPFFHNIFPSSITGLPGHLVENVTLENIHIRYPGRANKALAYLPLWRLDDIPEVPADYPEFSMFGELPAWGFYVRHVDGLAMNNIRVSIAAPDYRPAMVFDDTHNLSMESVVVEGDNKDVHIVLHNSEGSIVNSSVTAVKK